MTWIADDREYRLTLPSRAWEPSVYLVRPAAGGGCTLFFRHAGFEVPVGDYPAADEAMRTAERIAAKVYDLEWGNV